MTRFLFQIELAGEGDTLDEAWRDAVEGFCADPGTPESSRIPHLGAVDIKALGRIARVLRKALKDEADDKIDDGRFRDLIVGTADDLAAMASTQEKQHA